MSSNSPVMLLEPIMKGGHCITPALIKHETRWLEFLRIATKVFLWLGLVGGMFGALVLGGSIFSLTEITHFGGMVRATDAFNYLAFFMALSVFWFLTFLITTVLNVFLNMAVRISHVAGGKIDS